MLPQQSAASATPRVPEASRSCSGCSASREPRQASGRALKLGELNAYVRLRSRDIDLACHRLPGGIVLLE
jgi:hypothetical protein